MASHVEQPETSSRPLRFAIIGAGMAGVLSAIKLAEAGLNDFTVYEKADRVGGTWRENRYPGLNCDVPSQLYCYSFAPNPDWTRPYSEGDEIQTYFERVANTYGVDARTRFGDEVQKCEYVDGRWHLRTASGHQDVVDVVIAATGVLHHPKYPDIPGLHSFAGTAFHSARWDQDVVLDGRRVGIIGTGSTGVQIVSAISDRVASLHVFQRSAQWILPMDNTAFSSEQVAANQDIEGLKETHTHLSKIFARFSNAVIDAASPEAQTIAQMCLHNLETNVVDDALRERLRPSYQAACKRLIASSNFYEAIQHANTRLITDEIECVVPSGVRTVDGQIHELDVLVLATGFHADWFMRPMEIVGSDGVSLQDAWDPRPLAYLSMTMPDFPNFFMINGPNGPIGNFSLIDIAEAQFAYIQQLIDRLRRSDVVAIAPTRAATDALEAERVEAASRTVWMTGCKSWYLDDRGVPATWPWTFDRFQSEMEAPKWEAFECTRASG